jgi:protein O-GlcNAc transferase
VLPAATRRASGGPTPALANGFITFGSYNAYQKLTDATVALWAAVLHAVPRARLCLKALQFADASTRGAAVARFVAAGVEESRLLVRPPLDSGQALAAYGDLDIALDPTPYNGATTTCEALWMGVPAITLAGERLASRMGVSILEAVGLPELVAHSEQDFVRRASALANDLSRLQSLRGGLRARMQGAPICDPQGGARALEAEYQKMWAAWAQGGALSPA